MDLKQRCAEMREFFDEKASSIGEVHAALMPTKTVVTDLLPEGTRKILDLGAGTGMELAPLFERFPDAHVTALDISPRMLEELKKRPFADRLTVVCGDFFEVGFGDGYDAVISTSALHHFLPRDKARLYGKVFASLRHGGLFVNSDCVFGTVAEEVECFRRYEEDPTVVRHFDTPLAIETERRLLLDAGFVDFTHRPIEANKLYAAMTARKP